ncbi:arylamine N-acetyltransferase family protein [Catenulispora subtropica]|uniref:Arylamine N-acetyltransferase n=1 Tax=Catenulispora subtropica TaxID=450798 RepID=A0ABN2RPC0_9ACTN
MSSTPQRLHPEQVVSYLERIGVTGPLEPDAESLRRLHSAHLHTVPFENLSIHLGEDMSLDVGALYEKIVTRRRGGFCYELNGLFAVLLESLGYRVRRMSVRTFSPDHGFSPPADHLALHVTDQDGTAWLTDVGFGRHTEYPLRFDDRGEQADPGGLFRITEYEDGELDVLRVGEQQYRIDPRALALSDFKVAMWWQRTSPEALFTRNLICSVLTDDGGRVSLSGRRLVTTAADPADRTEKELGTDGEVLAAYRELFGIELDRVPEVRKST